MIGRKKKIVLFSLIIMFFSSIGCLLFTKFIVEFKQEKDISLRASSGQIFTVSGLVSSQDGSAPSKEVMKKNTALLQAAVDNAHNACIANGIEAEDCQSIVKIPRGVYYFAVDPNDSNHNDFAEMGHQSGANYVIHCKNNVKIIGAGMDNTILKPFGKDYEHGLDMFWYRDHKTFKPLKNADFTGFTIDGKEATLSNVNNFNARGKGFMLDPIENCDWYGVKVRYTDGTGFGVDLPVNCTMENCVAIACGKVANERSVGASGFGIGIGRSENESMYIKNCIAVGNAKFGFFFEHQGRFWPDEISKFPAKGAKGSNLDINSNDDFTVESSVPGFIVENCIASTNGYDFGGEHAYDLTYKNCTSGVDIAELKKDKDHFAYETNSYRNLPLNPHSITTSKSFYFGLLSRRIKLENNRVVFSDRYTGNYAPAVKYAINNGLVDVGWTTTLNYSSPISKIAALNILYRMFDHEPGEILLGQSKVDMKFPDATGAKKAWYALDVSKDDWYYPAVSWAKENGIISTDAKYSSIANGYVNRYDFLTMLWRCVGSPKVDTNVSFPGVPDAYLNAVKWAYVTGLDKMTTNEYYSGNYTQDVILNILYNLSLKQHVVTYDYWTNGGIYSYKNVTGSSAYTYAVSSDKVLEKDNIDLSVTANKAEYEFVGWNTNKSAKVGLSSLSAKAENMTLYAIYKKNISVSFVDYNGNSQNRENKKATVYNNEAPVMIAPAIDNYPGWTPKYWISGNKIVLPNEQNHNFIDGEIYNAAYRKSINVFYNANGGSGSIPPTQTVELEVISNNITKVKGQSIVIPSSSLKKTGYKFVGWNTKTDGTGKKYSSGESIIFYNNTPLYAMWEKDNSDYLDLSKFSVDEQNKHIEKIEVGTKISDIRKKINTNGQVTFVNSSMSNVDDNSTVATGYSVKIKLNSGTVNYKLVVVGDVRGTGKVTMADVMKVANQILDSKTIQGTEYLKAADVTFDGSIKMNDVMKLASYVLEGGSLV